MGTASREWLIVMSCSLRMHLVILWTSTASIKFYISDKTWIYGSLVSNQIISGSDMW